MGGKISRVLAAKLSLSIRVDALGEDSEATVARAFKDYVERKLMACEDGDDIDASKRHLRKANNASAVEAVKNVSTNGAYNTEADAVTDSKEKKSKKRKEVSEDAETVAPPSKKKKKAKSGAEPVVA